MRTITLELLRHGPPNNQLLSPLTPYLALCENHGAVTVRVPFMHNQFLHRLRALGYHLGDEARAFQLQDTASELGEVIAQVPGLVAELSGTPSADAAPDGACLTAPLTHLRLVVSAAELALLPFELALAPNGFPGAGQSLLLQSQHPLCLTRETRRVAERCIEWPKSPRILFVAAAPPGVGPIPVEAHLLALRRLIDPWVGYWKTDAEREQAIAEALVFLPDATAEAVEEQCATGRYTHVHILAHGAEYTEGYDVRHGIALHDAARPDGPADVVSGERLKTILRATQPAGAGRLARPAVVTLASCYSGQGGTVYGMGASVAHALHEAGVPLVIAGQFPLSFAGSVLMVQVLYDGLLRGQDPRVALSDLRRRLHSQFPRAHDWASIVAYASFPASFEIELRKAQVDLARRSVDVALDWADQATGERLSSAERRAAAPPPAGGLPSADAKASEEALRRILDRIDAARDRLGALLAGDRSDRARVCHQLASTEKRRAEAYLVLGDILDDVPGAPGSTRDRYVAEFYRSMLRARQFYWDAFEQERSVGWRVVQYLSAHLVLTRLRDEFVPPGERVQRAVVLAESDHDRPGELWSLAHVLSLNELRSPQTSKVLWALTNLVELYLLLPLIRRGADAAQRQQWADEAKRHARAFVARTDTGSPEQKSLGRQIARYVHWYGRIADLAEIEPLARELKAILDLRAAG